MEAQRPRPYRPLLPATFIFLVTGNLASADTTVGGLITADTHWTAANSPYVVTLDILVVNNATLTIDPGVEVRLDPSVGIEVAVGQLLARGTQSNRIRFTTNLAGPVADTDRWDRIQFSDDSTDATFDTQANYTGGSIIEYATIEYAGCSTKEGAVRADNASPYISQCLIRNNTACGIGAYRADGLRVVGNMVTGNSPFPAQVAEGSWRGYGAGIYIEESDGVMLSGNRIIENDPEGNTDGAVYITDSDDVSLSGDSIEDNFWRCGLYVAGGTDRLVLSADPDNPTSIRGNSEQQVYNHMYFTSSYDPDGPGNIDGRNVWWGTTDVAEIQTAIYDYFDANARGIVFYSPFAVPEPATLSLLALGACLPVFRRKRR